MTATKRTALFLVAGMGLNLCCATITEKATVEDDPLPVRATHRRLPVAPTQRADVLIIGAHLEATVSQDYQCEDVQTPISRRRRTTVREASGMTAAMSLAVSGGLLALGGYSYFGANSLAAQDSDNNTPHDYRTTGIALAATGVLAAGIAAVDAVRSRTSVENQGIVEGIATRSTTTCNIAPVASSDVLLLLGTARIPAKTDLTGKAIFDLRRVSLRDLRSNDPPSSLLIGDQAIAFHVSDESRMSLERELAADADSAVARGLLSLKADACRSAVRDAIATHLGPASSTKAIQLTRQKWTDAKETCGDLWSAEQLTELRRSLLTVVPAWTPLIDKASANLDSAVSHFRHDITPKSILELENALEASTDTHARCEPIVLKIDGLESSCSRLDDSIKAAGSAHDQQMEKISAVREAAARAEHSRDQAKAMAAWRAHFAQCRRLGAAIRKLENISARGQCGGDCMRVVEKMRAEEERLKTFSVSVPIDDPATARSLDDECNQAGCEVCP